MEVKGLGSLKVWVRAIRFAVRIHRDIVPRLPESEAWGMARQVRRSAQSIPANTAEAFGRFYYQDGVRHCYIARGSLEETRSHLYLAKELGYIQHELFGEMDQEANALRRMLSGYMAFLKRSRRGGNVQAG